MCVARLLLAARRLCGACLAEAFLPVAAVVAHGTR